MFTAPRMRMAWRVLALLACSPWAFVVAARAEEPASRPMGQEASRQRGEAVYKARCASCHGEGGEGMAGAYEEPLIGDASIGELTRLIADTMPEDAPEQCVGEEAAAVAEYIHYAFYSEAARVRNRPPSITLARLTAPQLRRSLADLYTRASSTVETSVERGLRAEYFDGSRRRRESRKIERVDPVIEFDFGHEGPGEQINPKDFLIVWRGGVLADVSGRYTIVIRSSCAFMCHFGASGNEFINNRVQSGDKTEFRRSIHLVGGRVYPIEIEFFQRERKTEQPPARLSLGWVAPGRVEQLIPSRNLLAASPPSTFALQAELPPDDRSFGYERGVAIDRQWDDSTTAAAIEFARIAESELWPRYRREHRRESDENRARLRAFLAELVETAFRGPLDDATRKLYIDDQVDATEDTAEAIRRCLLMSLKSPRFLYPTLDADRSLSQRAANRLALVLFDSLPADRWLVDEARKDALKDEAVIRRAAVRMVDDFRARGKTREFLHAWLNVEHFGELAKDSETYPGFDEALVSDLRASLDTFLDEVAWGERGDFRQFFLADWAYTTDRMAEFYGESWKAAESDQGGLRPSRPDPGRRAGLLTHPYLMSGLAYHDASSPIHRGVFLIRYLLGRTIRPPAEAFTPLSPDLHPDLTTRQRVALQTSPESCQICHSRINSLGFVLENFDAVGRYREQDREKPVDSTGEYTAQSGEVVRFQGGRQLAEFLASSDDAHRAFVSRAFQHFVKQPPAAYGPDTLDRLTDSFRESEFNVRELLVEIAVTAALQPVVSADSSLGT